jgi:hypothetical protein
MQLQFKFGLSRKIQLKEINLKNIAKHLKNIPNFNTGFRYCRRASQKKGSKKQKKNILLSAGEGTRQRAVAECQDT